MKQGVKEKIKGATKQAFMKDMRNIKVVEEGGGGGGGGGKGYEEGEGGGGYGGGYN